MTVVAVPVVVTRHRGLTGGRVDLDRRPCRVLPYASQDSWPRGVEPAFEPAEGLAGNVGEPLIGVVGYRPALVTPYSACSRVNPSPASDVS